jgi:hypothetical protein
VQAQVGRTLLEEELADDADERLEEGADEHDDPDDLVRCMRAE